MTTNRKSVLVNLDANLNLEPLREHETIFESCKCGDISKVKKLINSQTVNARDTAGN
jgi:tankyrase